jgi:hypothetical protein
MRALVAGWFSFEDMGATAGDLVSRDVVCDWLAQEGVAFDVATAPPFKGGVAWRTVDASRYSHIVFVCGPFGNGQPVTALLARFSHCRKVGVDLTMLQSLDEWNPFDLLIERDSDRRSHPDLAFLSGLPRVPVLGLTLIDSQPEYGDRDAHEEANAALTDLATGQDAAVVRIDTRLDVANEGGLRTPAQIVSLIASLDVMATSRLHGLVLALASGVPVVAVDPVSGGGKVSRQARTVGWPHVFRVSEFASDDLEAALSRCLRPDGRQLALECRSRASSLLEGAHAEFAAYMLQSRGTQVG